MKKIHLLYIIILFSTHVLTAQKQVAHWYFGEYAGLDFNKGYPIAISDGQVDTFEGCATISDPDGKLLFYTDGITVWNREHNIMPNGKNLSGHQSSTQSAIIIPKPNDSNIYYIFTVDWVGGGTNQKGLNYYTVDMRRQAGRGELIVQYGTNLSENLLSAPTSEKITSVKDFNEEAYWVIAYKEGRFYVYKIDSNGVNNTPVEGNTGFSGSKDARGYLKSSPNGRKLVSANYLYGAYLYDFDNGTGKVTNERLLDIQGHSSYGVEFSRLSKKLYISTTNDDQIEKLYQFSLDIPVITADNLNATRVELFSHKNSRSALQLGLDGRIYRTIEKENFLGVIKKPEKDGIDARYVHHGVSLGDRVSNQGLPPFVQSFFEASIEIDFQCFGEETRFEIYANEELLSTEWKFGDGSTSQEIIPHHAYAAPGEYNIEVLVTSITEVKTIKQVVRIFEQPQVNASVDLWQCDDDTDGITKFNLTEAQPIMTEVNPSLIFTYYYNLDDALKKTNAIEEINAFSNQNHNKIFARVENPLECYAISEISLKVSNTDIPIDYMLHVYACEDDYIDGVTTFSFESATQEFKNLFSNYQNLDVSYYETLNDALLEQDKIESSSFRNENSPDIQKLVVRVENVDNNSCVGMGYHLTLHLADYPQYDVRSTQYLCNDNLPLASTITIDNPKGNYTYEWRNSNEELLLASSSPFLDVIEVGNYYVTVISEKGCIRTEMITVEISNKANIESIDLVDLSQNNSVVINVSGNGNYEYSLNDRYGIYQDDNYFYDLVDGVNIVFVRDKNGCGIVSQNVNSVGVPSFFTPNGDGINDYWPSNKDYFEENANIFIYDRFGKLILQVDENETGWDGNYQGNPLPKEDYWYVIKLDDGRTFKGHFSLIRR